jgi:hypothetical protein
MKPGFKPKNEEDRVSEEDWPGVEEWLEGVEHTVSESGQISVFSGVQIPYKVNSCPNPSGNSRSEFSLYLLAFLHG